jgi:electron transfer flavoprotein alpha subunit
MKVLIIIEHDGQSINPATLSSINAASEISTEIVGLLIGYHTEALLNAAKKMAGFVEIIVADHEVYAHLLAENVSELVADIAKTYDYVMCSASTFGKDLMPRVAALLDVEQLSDITKIIDKTSFVRPIYAGNAFATVQFSAKIKCMTIRASAFSKIHLTQSIEPKVTFSDKVYLAQKTRYVSSQLTQSPRPDLSYAKIVVSGGRGLQNAENFQWIEKIADLLNAAVGATRAAVDAGFVPNDYQVGQTGKIVAPDLYIAIGISGAIQHLAGMKDSQVIVAINKDGDAPIFQIADYGLIGDLFEILPELEAALKSS